MHDAIHAPNLRVRPLFHEDRRLGLLDCAPVVICDFHQVLWRNAASLDAMFGISKPVEELTPSECNPSLVVYRRHSCAGDDQNTSFR